MQQKSQSRLYQKKRALPILRQQDALQAKNKSHSSKSKMSIYSLELKVKGDTKKLYESFYKKKKKRDRSSLKITKKKDHLLFKITSKDAIALKATINGVIKLLEVEEKISSLTI